MHSFNPAASKQRDGKKRIGGPPPQPSLPAIRQAILDIFAPLFPWQRPSTPPTGSAASTGGGSASVQEAQYRCSGSTVVWANEHSHIYPFPGSGGRGHTKSGDY